MTTVDVCPGCARLDCRHFRGGRSEAAYQDCIAHTAARADAAREAVRRAGRDPKWAAVYTWMDEHREQIYKDCFDANGRLENELAVARKNLKDAEADLKRALDEGADEHCARMEMARELEELRAEVPKLERRAKDAERDLSDPYRVKIAEEDRQMILMCLSRETILHPGFGYAIGLIADKFPGGREMLESFRQIEQPGVAPVEK